MKIVIIQEIVPHYRIPLFTYLSNHPDVELTVLASSEGVAEGFGIARRSEVDFRWEMLRYWRLPLAGGSIIWLSGLFDMIRKIRPDVIVTTGNKRFVQNNWLMRWRGKLGYRLFFYQHAKTYGARSGLYLALERAFLGRYVFPQIDGLIVYTDEERTKLIADGFESRRIFAVNNTIDTRSIRRLSQSMTKEERESIWSSLGLDQKQSMLYVGRLIEGKSLEILIQYHKGLRTFLPDLQLIVVGSGPLREAVEKWAAGASEIKLLGSIYDELVLSAIMSMSRFVFLPGYSGLTINHSFAYGKPYVTIRGDQHKPEFSYLKDGFNGLVLDPVDESSNIRRLLRLFEDEEYYIELCRNAEATAENLTIEQMGDRFLEAFAVDWIDPKNDKSHQ